MEAWGERIYSSYSFMTSAVDGGEWSASHPGHALLWGREPQYPFYRRLGGPSASVDTEDRGKISFLFGGSNLDSPVVQSSQTLLTELPRLPTIFITSTYFTMKGNYMYVKQQPGIKKPINLYIAQQCCSLSTDIFIMFNAQVLQVF
jgi:hypothetical protein